MNRSALTIGIVVGIFVSSAAFSGSPHAAAQETADLVLRGGKVVTLDPKRPQAEALAVAEGRILALGGNAEIDRLRGPRTRVVELRGRLAVPGFIESHGHLLGIGQAQLQLNLVGTTSPKQIAEIVRRRAAESPPGTWIVGRGWDQNDWERKEFPDHGPLSAAAPENPVLLTRIDGHAAWANRRALEAAGLTRAAREVPGGRIIRDADGEPTGVLIDRAIGLVSRHVPPLSGKQARRAIELGIRQCLAHGITTFHDAGVGRETIALYRKRRAEGQLPLRLYVMLRGDEALLEEYFARGPEVDEAQRRLTIRAVKLIADGALGSRGAALLQPYDDAPGDRGLLILDEDDVYRVAERALRHGFQVATHAIGDRANRVALNAYERAFRAHPDVKDSRFRIEHAQVLHEADIPRFAELGVIASMQATHCTSDMPWVHARIGPRRAAAGAYVWGRLLKSGARIANGSDAPVESVDPLWGIYAAVTRCDHQGRPSGGWYPDQRMTREQALRSFTIEGAYAAFEEHVKGTLEAGKLADVTVLSRDILTAPSAEILKARAELTIVGGKVVYER